MGSARISLDAAWPRARDVSGSRRLLVVKCGPYRLAIPAEVVRGVVAASEVVPVESPRVRGLVWRDGALLPVASLAPFLGLEEQERIEGHGVLVSSTSGPLCFLVDEAVDLVEAPAESFRSLPSLVTKVAALPGLESAVLLDGVLLLLDLGRLLSPEVARHLVRSAGQLGGMGDSTPHRG